MLPRLFLLTSLCWLTFSSTSVDAQDSSYPTEFVKSYINRCTAGRGLVVHTVCECIIKKIQNRYTYDEFKIINSRIEKTEEIPPDIVENITSCQANSSS